MNKVKYLGIDFGSCNTVITAMTEDAKIHIFNSIRDAKKTEFETVALKVGDIEEIYFSYDEAYKVAAKNLIEPKNITIISNEMKEDVEKEEITNLCKEYFVKLVDKLKENCQDTQVSLDKLSDVTVCVGYPAYFEPGDFKCYCNAMTEIIHEAFGCRKENISFEAEPVLAAQAYNYVNQSRAGKKLKDGQKMLVLDFGGHTLDVAIMEAHSAVDGKFVLTKLADSKSFKGKIYLGKDITKRLGRYLSDNGLPYFDWEVEKEKCRLFEGNYKNPERDSKQSQKGNRFVLTYDKYRGDKATDIKYISFEEIKIDNIFGRFGEKISEYLKSIKKELKGSKIGAILYTGGASKMSPLRGTIQTRISEFCEPNCVKLYMDDTAHDDKVCKKLRLTVDLRDDDERGDVPLSSMNAVALGAVLSAADEFDYEYFNDSEDETNFADEEELMKAKSECKRLETENKELITDLKNLCFLNERLKRELNQRRKNDD